jgi:hypothetical protein
MMTLMDSPPHAEPARGLKVAKSNSLPSSSDELKWSGLNCGTSEASGSIQMKSRIRRLGMSLTMGIRGVAVRINKKSAVALPDMLDK